MLLGYKHDLISLLISSLVIYHKWFALTKHFYSAISKDHAIEQVYMKSIKSVGGMNGPGKGLNDDANRNLWLYSRPMCSLINE